jgi:putative aldouronate transport system substrate-binding protein
MNGRIGLSGRANPGHWKVEEDGTTEKIEAMKAVNPNAEVVFGLPPVGPDGKSGTNSDGRVGANHMFTVKATEDPRVVEKILEIANANVNDFDHFVRVNFGIEGDTFEINENGTYVSLLEDGEHPKMYGLGVFAPINNPEFSAKVKGNADDYVIDRTAGRMTGNLQPKVPSTEAYGKYGPDLRRIAAEAFIKIITGEESIEYFDTFKANYLKNGGQETLDQMQNAFKDALNMN